VPRSLLVAGALTLLVAACEDGGGEGPATARRPGGGSGVCALLRRDEIATAVGNAVAEGSGEVGPNLCDWTSAPDDTSVSVSLLVGPSRELCVEALVSDPANDESPGFEDPTYWSYLDILGGIGNVVVCADAGQLTLTLMAGVDAEPGERDLRESGEQLARVAADRL
jgi:hypothetical protein